MGVDWLHDDDEEEEEEADVFQHFLCSVLSALGVLCPLSDSFMG